MINIDYYEEIAYKFRKALESVVKKQLYGRLMIFRSFPRECCRYTSDLLAEYMMEQGIPRESIKMIEGESHKEGYSHCWLLIENSIIVDITGDQFNKEPYFKKYMPITECYVESSDYASMHDCFNNSNMRYLYNVGIDSYTGDVPFKLQVVYDAILEQMDKGE